MASIGGIDLTGGTIAAFGTLLVYDVFFVTFADEVKLVWPSRWTYAKVLFFLNRYLPFVDTFLSLHLLLGKNTDRECLLGFKAAKWNVLGLIVVGIMISELILTIRTYALWGGSPASRIILIILIVDVIAIYTPSIVIVQLEVESFAYEAAAVGCTKTKSSSSIVFIAFLLLIVSETVIVTLTLIRAWKHHRQTQSALLVRMYKDGLLYYFYLLAFAIVNLLIAVAAPPEFANWLTTPQRVLHSLLCTRVLLHIRAHALDADASVTLTRADLSFAAVGKSQSQAGSGGTGTVTHSAGRSGTISSGTHSGTGTHASAVRSFQGINASPVGPGREHDLEGEGTATGAPIELQVRTSEARDAPGGAGEIHQHQHQHQPLSPRARSKFRAGPLEGSCPSANDNDEHERHGSTKSRGRGQSLGAVSLGESSRPV